MFSFVDFGMLMICEKTIRSYSLRCEIIVRFSNKNDFTKVPLIKSKTVILQKVTRHVFFVSRRLFWKGVVFSDIMLFEDI